MCVRERERERERERDWGFMLTKQVPYYLSHT
jgi:hypothetical protein